MPEHTGRESDKFMLRLPDGMRDRIKSVADANGRSMNAEIVSTLSEAYPQKALPELGWRVYRLLATMNESQRDDFAAEMLEYWEAMVPEDQVPLMMLEVEMCRKSLTEFEKANGRHMDEKELREFIDDRFPGSLKTVK